jgi:peptidyl-prolyl cis-trans isomerase B (cyclophilin B)
MDVSQPVAGDVLLFSAQYNEGDSFRWDFGDGTIFNGQTGNHIYTNSGRYEVNLTVKRGKRTQVNRQTIWVLPPESCLVAIETNKGTMIVKLYDETPLHRDNFTKLVESGFYNQLLFHRVINGFMIQGGDPDSKDSSPGEPLGMGGPGYTIKAEFNPQFVHQKGALAAARMGDAANPNKESSGSQFYIVQGQPLTEGEIDKIESRKEIRYSSEQRKSYLENGGTPFLDFEYTVFGQVIRGWNVIDEIASVRTDSRNRPEEDIVMSIKLIK